MEIQSYLNVLYRYFESEDKVDYTIEWMRGVLKKELVNRILFINDCSYSRRFTHTFLRSIKAVYKHFQIIYLINEHEDIGVEIGPFSRSFIHAIENAIDSTDVHLVDTVLSDQERNSGIVIVIKNSEWLRHEVDTAHFFVLNVRKLMKCRRCEAKILEDYYKLKKRIKIKKELRKFIRSSL